MKYEKTLKKLLSYSIRNIVKKTFFIFPGSRGKFLYLDRSDYGRIGPVCRLTYTGDMDDWEFAIFKWSSETYDPDEWMFPGSGEVDGTVKGAMKAGLEAYPV